MVTFSVLGTSNVTLTASNTTGSSSKVRTVTVIDNTPGITMPTTEGFESPGVPANWTVLNPNSGSTAWAQTNAAAYEGSNSFFIDGSNCGANQSDILESPIIDVANATNQSFVFSLAYRQKDASQNDALKIQGSKDCGGTWTDITVLSAAAMQANTGGLGSDPYVPGSPLEWRTYTISGYPAWFNFTSSSSVKIRFNFVEGNTGGGNNLYIDAINLFGGTPTNTTGINELTRSYKYSVAPNPSNGETNVKFSLNDASNVKVSVMDMIGKEVVPATESQFEAGEHNVIVNKGATLPKGVYFVNLSVNGAKMSRKLIIN
jgi:hypothetical protein